MIWIDETPGNRDTFYRRSTDGGATFIEPAKNLSSNAGVTFDPAIAISGSIVHVVWVDNTLGGFDIFYRRSTDSGSTFPNIIKNLSGSGATGEGLAIAATGDSVHVVWQDVIAGNSEIFYRRSIDGGATYPNVIKNLSGSTGPSGFPAIAVSETNIHVVWLDSTPGNFDILYRRSTDGGSTFPNIIKNLSDNAGSSRDPDIAITGGNLYVVWANDVDPMPGVDEILYRTSSDNGATFPALFTNLSVNAGDSRFPAIAAS